MKNTIIYKRNNFGTPIYWSITLNNNDIDIKYGTVASINKSMTFIPSGYSYENIKKAEQEYNSKINQKIKEGYKYLSELSDEAPESIKDNETLIKFLNNYLPKYNTDGNNFIKPMLAKAFSYSKVTYPRIAQPKINGVRCLAKLVETKTGLFSTIDIKLKSREGGDYDCTNVKAALFNLHSNNILNDIFENGSFDGELYIPQCSINEINHHVKNKDSIRHGDVKYFIYDLAIENIAQIDRTSLINCTKLDHSVFLDAVNNLNVANSTIVLVPSTIVHNDEESKYLRDECIFRGFEGLILRDIDDEYQFGKRNNTMIKYKRSTDGIFTIVDIEKENKRDIPLLICKNDINNSTFPCHINGTFIYQKTILDNIDKFIGKSVYIEYSERSGVNEVPFHINTVMIYDK